MSLTQREGKDVRKYGNKDPAVRHFPISDLSGVTRLSSSG